VKPTVCSPVPLFPEEGPHEPLPECLTRYTGFLVAKAHQRLFTRYSGEFRRHGIEVPHAGILHLLHDFGPMSQQQLGQKLRIDRTTMVKLVDALERQRLASRRNHPEDRRAYRVEITPEGSKILATVGVIADRLEAELFGRFTEHERKLIRRALLTLAG
jgi:DNA-binding MarR family transcriptional regulator